jgi:hypothetical protein
VYAVQHGDLYVRGGRPYWFEDFPFVLSSPAGGNVLARLAAWRDDPAPGMSVLLVHGSGPGPSSGGLDGARLAARFAAESVDQEWTVWSAHHATEPPPQQFAEPTDTGPAIVAVVEHAEKWNADDLQLLFQSPILHSAPHMRILLVGKEMPEWWPAMRHRLGKIGIATSNVVAR